MKYFIDNCLSPQIANALHALIEDDGCVVQHVADRYPEEEFPEGVEDLQWINDLSAEGGWVVISRDERIVRNPFERAALLEGNIIVYVLAAGWRHQKRWPMTWGIIRWWEKLMTHARKSPERRVYKVPFRFSEKRGAIQCILRD